ncbi:TIGR02647 family protein [Spongiibacter sp. IMCC21906]|jgi:uncharacterized protein (TIGR02647 family)|uniref:TIGR02647 family protein n=1 Tax=Spongiibacter sp. IMCC21906 TaxID=1620392 RepID=UPI001E4D8732|nr:TIGR02647 family protein [Spongiibacter sp. IMCC21906]
MTKTKGGAAAKNSYSKRIITTVEITTMRLQHEILEELRLLAQFNPDSTLEGIKVHHTAEASMVEASERLYAKGMVSQPDGGYLTLRGQEAVQHLDNVLSLLDCAIAHH